MDKAVARGAERLRRWRHKEGMRLCDIGEKLGDQAGDQVRKFETGTRHLPLPLAVRVSTLTGIPLRSLLHPKQRDLIAEIQVTLDRDAGLR